MPGGSCWNWKVPSGYDRACGEATRGVGQRDAVDVRTAQSLGPDRCCHGCAGRCSRHALDGSFDRSAVIAQDDVNRKTRAAGANYQRLAQEIDAACDSRGNISP